MKSSLSRVLDLVIQNRLKARQFVNINMMSTGGTFYISATFIFSVNKIVKPPNAADLSRLSKLLNGSRTWAVLLCISLILSVCVCVCVLRAGTKR